MSWAHFGFEKPDRRAPAGPVYHGGPEPLSDPAGLAGELPGGVAVDLASARQEQSPDSALLEAAEMLVCDKWGSFAGEYEVTGRLVVDVEAERIVRVDGTSIEEHPTVHEVEEL